MKKKNEDLCSQIMRFKLENFGKSNTIRFDFVGMEKDLVILHYNVILKDYELEEK